MSRRAEYAMTLDTELCLLHHYLRTAERRGDGWAAALASIPQLKPARIMSLVDESEGEAL